jgi:hypothetical protein
MHCHKLGHTTDMCWAQQGKELKANLVITSERVIALMATATKASQLKGECTTWYLNTGATQHMTCQRDWLHNYCNIPTQMITFSNNSRISTIGISTVVADNDHNRVKIQVELCNVLYVPHLKKNLILMLQLVMPQ